LSPAGTVSWSSWAESQNPADGYGRDVVFSTIWRPKVWLRPHPGRLVEEDVIQDARVNRCEFISV
jgi:hypothetical protein